MPRNEVDGGCQGLGDRGNGEMVVESYKLPVINSRDLIYIVVTIVSDTVLYTCKLLREQSLNDFTTYTR